MLHMCAGNRLPPARRLLKSAAYSEVSLGGDQLIPSNPWWNFGWVFFQTNINESLVTGQPVLIKLFYN